MALAADAVRRFREFGYVELGPILGSAEADIARSGIDELRTHDDERRILEVDGERVRSLYDVHRTNALLGRLVRDVRLVQPAMQLLGGEVYVHQTQANPKSGVGGDVWDWHQDLLYWRREDDMPGSDVLNVAVHLTDVTPESGPLRLIPGTQQRLLDAETHGEGWASTLAAYLKHTMRPEVVDDLIERHGVVDVLGRRGTIVIMDGAIVHSSGVNRSGSDRTILFIRYNRTTNALGPGSRRPDWLASRDSTPVHPLLVGFAT